MLREGSGLTHLSEHQTRKNIVLTSTLFPAPPPPHRSERRVDRLPQALLQMKGTVINNYAGE